MKFSHTPLSAAQCLRAVFESSIAKTWEDYDRQLRRDGHWLNSHSATKLVQEQCNGMDMILGGVAQGPYTYEGCSRAVAEIMPELFAEYWDGLKVSS